ncbi:LOW QUALITY PROTEIN: CST complex subunit CTC1 [Dunckerocampus dactyliophorus]|uniref:LOW QUALITY PROTEIN: CST complex subunit CTC1 n=1 Tax=Dunckerocampus dactyliophorus TaxID=161453 RepID=UPI002404F9E6|nr:LOW QUALITY PROTEIN: CST complex subunit CTC1 [Dunckerocampus dactyliophorus]
MDMDPLQLFRDQFNPHSEAEVKWLEAVFYFIRDHVCPVLSGPTSSCRTADQCASQLSVSVLKRIQKNMSSTHTLPVSYRLVCVSELLSHQRLACVSNLSWSTNQQQMLAREVELSLPGQQALPRANLLLIGCLTHNEDGELRLTDASGSIRCEVLSPSPLWLDRLVFLPHWHYIPQSAPKQAQAEAQGYVELIGSPVLLCPGLVHGLVTVPGTEVGPKIAVSVTEAATLIHNRTRGQRFSVYGQVAFVCPLLVVAGTSFFCFTLTDNTHTIPVLVKDSSRLWWTHCVSVGVCVSVTALRACVLQAWKGNILCVTKHSEIHKIHNQPHTYTRAEDTPQAIHPPLMTHLEEGQPETCLVQSAVRIKQSRVISYQGTVTEVVSEGAGLYIMDRMMGVCLAYQPTLRRKLRVGDTVQLHHVHFLYRPCPDFPPSMLCTCLRSTLTVTNFSRVLGSAPDRSCPGDGVLPRLLVERSTAVSQYLWTCHLSAQLRRSLFPSAATQCVCVLSWKLMAIVLGQEQRQRRDIYAEMLDEPHSCVLMQYATDLAQHQYVSLSDLCKSLQEDSWASLSLSSLLPPTGGGLTRVELNTALAWSSRTLSSDCRNKPGKTLRQRPLLLVGVLELPSHTSHHTLQLRDGTGVVACVITETTQEEGEGRRAVFNTAWIGCLVCVQQFTMVTERFLQSDFPSYQHLDQDKFITHKHCRVYLQFSQDCLHILSPSVAMETHQCLKGVESVDEEEKEKEVEIVVDSKRRRDDEGPEASQSSSSSTTTTTYPCISVVLRLEQKTGVTWMNTGSGREEQEAGLIACFSAKTTVVGPVVVWGQDPKNRPMKDFEADKEKQVTVVCSGASARWFPILQPECFYRLVVPNTHDRGVLIGCAVTGQSHDFIMKVQSDWRFHTLTRPLLAHTNEQSVSATVSSVSEVLDDSCADVVCFQGFVSERINLDDRTRDTGHTDIGVRLTVCDQNGRSIHVYLKLKHNTYPPGLLPGNTLMLSAFHRRLSRTGSVYCTNLPVSCVTVMHVQDKSSEGRQTVPIMHLGLWTRHSCTVARIKGHVVCFLFLQLQWKCSQCGSVYRQSACSQCRSSSASVFDSTAKLVIDDGTGEAHVRFSGVHVRQLLGLADSQWEGLQRALRLRGDITVYPRGRSPACYSDDQLLHFLLLCVRSVDLLSLTCSRQHEAKAEEVKRLSRSKRDFLTRMAPPPKLTCLHMHSSQTTVKC